MLLITRTRGIWETGSQESEAQQLLYHLREASDETSRNHGEFPPSLTIPAENYENTYQSIDAQCSYKRGGPEPWLFPGAGKSFTCGERFPVIVSPRPNQENRIVVGYSTTETENYLLDELPPEIEAFFE